jgi:SAM-dependent methyltransferase
VSEEKSKDFWNQAARDNAAWHIATNFTEESDDFFASGVREVDELLRLGELSIAPTATVLEIGSGVGRMTRRLAAIADTVIATDVSGEMLQRARANLTAFPKTQYVELSGNGDLPIADHSVDAVFSYITMQHVPTADAQERYFTEAIRVLAPGGWAFIQFRRTGVAPRLLDWVGHVKHRLSGRRTFDRAWRGARVQPRTLLAYNADEVHVDLMPHGLRHVWARVHRS